MSTIESLEDRVLKFLMLELDGQPRFMHMGTSYLVRDLMAEVRRLSALAQPAVKGDDAAYFKGRHDEAALQEALRAQPAVQGEPVAWRWSESNGERWFEWTCDWSFHDRAKKFGFGCLIEYAYPAQTPHETPT